MKSLLLWFLTVFFTLLLMDGLLRSDFLSGKNDEVVTTLDSFDKTQHNYIVSSENEQSLEKLYESTTSKSIADTMDVGDIPEYSGKAYVTINNNIPYFTEDEYTTTSFERYSRLDSLGRCGVAFANIGIEIMPTEERGSIGMFKPSGWQTVKYDSIDGNYLYNRCHLIGFQLAGENANEHNLITGTRYMNVCGMLPFENMVADYVAETENHVLYRVTPVFEGDNLLATGVLMEARSIEDSGTGICFNVFCYNEQPGIIINHLNGESKPKYTTTSNDNLEGTLITEQKTDDKNVNNADILYVANNNTKKFHHTDCNSVDEIKEKNKKYLTCTRNQAVLQGYIPCGKCKP